MGALKESKALKKFEKEEAEKMAAAEQAAEVEPVAKAPAPKPITDTNEAVEAEVKQLEEPETEATPIAEALEAAPVAALEPEPKPISAVAAPAKPIRLPNADDLGRVWIR